jgi:tetratricopeptide (TPR) repeat protein
MMRLMSNETRPDATGHLRDAQEAEAKYDWRSAVDAYERALADGVAQDEADVLTALGRCYWNLSEARTAWRTLRRAISLYQQRGDAAGQARATLEIVRIWGPPERHRQLINEAIEALGDGDPASKARLLLRYHWADGGADERWDEAMAIAERLGLDDVLAFRTQRNAWEAMDAGRVDDAVALFEASHEAYARLGVLDTAAGVLRNVGFQLIEIGELDRGYAYAERCFEYASKVGMLFTAQLALMDMAAVLFARGEFEQCEALLARSPGDSDFRGDLYRMWMAEVRGDVDGALGLLVSPDRGGNTPTAVGQIHAAAAGVLYRTGRHDAAAQAMRAWLAVERREEDAEFACFEGSALTECILALGDEALWRSVRDAFARMEETARPPLRFATLQGRALAPLRAGVAAKLGLREEAERAYGEGIAWCERERCTRDAAACRDGLASLG